MRTFRPAVVDLPTSAHRPEVAPSPRHPLKPARASPFSASMEPIFSTLADDPDIAELLDVFYDELVHRVREVEQAEAAGDRAALCSTAHQLAGSGGTFGFPPITSAARRVERCASAEPSVVAEAVRGLLVVCAQVAAGRGAPARR
ncbi:MAG: Hpt domain-containing protein [Byssovorax sp.]